MMKVTGIIWNNLGKIGEVILNGELSGEYGVKLDDMGRINLPRQLRDAVEKSELVLLRGGLPKLPCLWLYSDEEWRRRKELAVKKASLSVLERLNAKVPVEMDKQGRILIPPTLRKYARLSKDCILVGQDDRIVVWAEDRFDEYLEATGDGFTADWRELSEQQLKGKDFADDGAYSSAAGTDLGVSGSEGQV
jgi:MraZ protein